MQTSLKIGLLCSHSSIYPRSYQDFADGFLSAFPEKIKRQNYFVFVPEYVKQPSAKQVKESVQKLLFFDQVDIVSGLINYKTVPDIIPLVERQKRIAFFCDMGELIPYTQHLSDYFFFNSFQYWQSEYALGHWAHNEFGDKGVVVMSLYDSGYHLQSAFRQGTVFAGSKEIDYCVLHGDPSVSQVRSKACLFFEQLRNKYPSFIHAIFCGTEAVEFLDEFEKSGLNGKIPLLVSAHMASEEILAQIANLSLKMYSASMYDYHSTDHANTRFKQAYEVSTGRKANVFALLGFEMGLSILPLIPYLQKKDWDTVVRYLKNETVNSPRGTRSFYLNSEYSTPDINIEKIETNNQKVHKIAVSQGKAMKYDHQVYEEIHREHVSGWLNPYLCV